MDDLDSLLDELDRLIGLEQPALHARFRPGLSRRDVESLARGLRPFYLPAELLTVYRWHDGWDDSQDGTSVLLLPDARFNSLADGIAQYRVWLEALGSDGWHPLWFPAFGDRAGELVALQLEPGRPAGQVFAYHTDTDLSTSYDSVAALFATTLDCWRAGLMPYDPVSPPSEIRAVAARHNPRSRTAEGSPRREVSRFSTVDWPEEWKEVLGIEAATPAPAGLAVTIAELLADPGAGRPVRGEVRFRMGSSDVLLGTVTDATGSVDFVARREQTSGFRELAGGRAYEVWLAPDAAGRLATRVVPLDR